MGIEPTTFSLGSWRFPSHKELLHLLGAGLQESGGVATTEIHTMYCCACLRRAILNFNHLPQRKNFPVADRFGQINVLPSTVTVSGDITLPLSSAH